MGADDFLYFGILSKTKKNVTNKLISIVYPFLVLALLLFLKLATIPTLCFENNHVRIFEN